MKIVVFGGAGDVGSRAVEDLVVSEGVTSVTIADRDTVSAMRLEARLRGKGAPVRVRTVDARSHGALVLTMKGHDVAASALGPFFEFEPRLVRAAIDARVDYCSICDDWDAADKVMQFHDEARRVGTRVLVGLGASPGLSNVGVSCLADRVDEVDRVEVFVFLPPDMGGGGAGVEHGLHIMTGKVASWREGRKELVDACSEHRVVELPGPGRVKLWNMGHSEPLTLPPYLPGVRNIDFFMGFGVGSELLIYPARAGAFKFGPVRRRLLQFAALVDRIVVRDKRGNGAVRVDLWGKKAGRDVHHMLCGVGTMRDVTGLSLSAGALMLGSNNVLVSEGGVYPPEACLSPSIFFPAMQARGVAVFEDVSMITPMRLSA